MTAPAVSVAVVLTLFSQAVAAAEDRVFFGPAERARITASRAALLADGALTPAGNAGVPATVIEPAAATSVTPATAIVKLDGVSFARDGRAFAWIGGRPYESGALFQGRRLQVTRDGVRLAGGDGSTRLRRVGETLSGPASARAEKPAP